MEVSLRSEHVDMANLTVPTTQPKPKAKVMVVDDENGPRQSLRMLLKDDFDVRLACDVPSALLLLEEEEVHVVVSDIRMPLQTGVDLLQQVKEKNPETQVILLTGYPHLESAMQAVEFGAFAYLEKPFDNNVMMQRVQDAVNRYNAEHEHRVLEKLAIEANRFETLGRLVSGMIHDMGTPLSVVGSQIEIIMGNPNRPDLADRLGTMQSQVRHCSEMVRSAMNFLRYDTQPVTPFYINNLVETCLEVGRPILRSQNVKIERVLATDMPASIGDLVLVRQAVLNLIVNACHAMDKQENPRELTIETWSDNDYIYLAVEDSGPGIPPEVRQRVFETFFTTKGKKGTGLGLAVVKNVMNRHKGQVTLESGPGKGARFILQFPTASREEIVNLFTKKESS